MTQIIVKAKSKKEASNCTRTILSTLVHPLEVVVLASAVAAA